MALPEEPLSRIEKYLSKIAGESTELPEPPLSRIEQYLSAMAGEDVVLPEEALSRIEQYLEYIVEHGGGGGGDITVESLSATENKTYTAPSGKAYSPVVVNVPGPSGTKQISITENGTTTENVADYASAEITVNVPNSYVAGDEGKVVSNGALVSQSSGSTTQNGTVDTTLINSLSVNVQPEVRESVPLKAANFYDYDGIRLYSYTAQEFNALSALPANPSHSGLTAQGWNYTLAQAKSVLETYGAVDIGQSYVTSDGKTKIYIDLFEGFLTPTLSLALNGTAVVDWGDNSETDTLTSSNYNTHVTKAHEYAAAGKYVITITVTGTGFKFAGGTGGWWSKLLHATGFTLANVDSDSAHTPYLNAVHKIEIGSGCVGFQASAFRHMDNLETITIPTTATAIDKSAFNACVSLKHVTIPSGVTTLGEEMFTNCEEMVSVSLPPTLTSIVSQNFANYCHRLEHLVIPCGWDASKSVVVQDYELRRVSNPNAGAAIGYFQNCNMLDHIFIPSTATSLANSAFQECAGAKGSVTIPAGVLSIGSKAFQDCVRISEYHLLPPLPPTLSNVNAFANIQPGTKIYVPSGKLSNYQSASNWSTYASYMEEEPA